MAGEQRPFSEPYSHFFLYPLVLGKNAADRGADSMDRGIIAEIGAFVSVVIWGTTFVVSKDLMSFLTPLQLMLIRFSIAFVALWIVYPKWVFDPKKEWIFIVMAFFGNFLYFVTENGALTITYSSNVSIIASMTTIITLVLAHVIFKDRINAVQVGAIVLSVLGVALVSLNGAFVLHLEPAGDALVLLSAFSWAMYGILLRKYASGYDSLLVARKMMFYGILITLPFALCTWQDFDTALLTEPSNLLEILFLGLLGSCLCYVLWNFSLKEIGIVKSNLFLYIMPCVTMIAGYLVFDETITVIAIAGMLLIVFGMYVANRYTENGGS